MERNFKNNRKRQIAYVIIGVFCIQFFVIALIYFNGTNVTNVNTNEAKEYNDKDEPNEEIIIADGILPNLTRLDYPIVLNNDSAEALWTALHGRHVNNIRIAYYSLDNQWKLVPFQLDEMGYFRSFTYEIGFQASVSFTSPSNVDVVSWAHYVADHRYAGKDIDAQAGAAYKEPTEWECETGFWASRLAENYIDGDTPPDPPSPTQPVEEAPGGPKEQLLRRLDWDDELCFYAKNGKLASSYSWWNYAEYPNRYRVEINDPVDGGQTWMYIYYNNVDMTNPPDYNHFIPAGEKDYVSWDKINSKITAETYELQIDASNKDLDAGVKIKWPGLTANTLLTSSKKQYLSSWFHINYDYGLGTLDVQDDTEIWRDGQWDEGYYDEQYSSIGYNVICDLDLTSLNGNPNFPGQDGVARDNHRTTGFGGQTHSEIDNRLSVFIAGQILAGDAGDHDGDTSEVVPFVRGMIDQSGATNEAAIDGPCRVILDKMQVQVVSADLGGAIDYEELWTIATTRIKYYAQMTHQDPTSLDLNMNDDPGSDMQIDLEPHFAFMFTQRYSPFVRSDPGAYILLGGAPNGVPGINLDFTPAGTGTHSSWPLTLYPDGVGTNDGVSSGGNPIINHFDNTHLLPSTGAANNPLSDWTYLSTSSGGMWQYIPYNEWWALFTQYAERDLATYWKDTSGGGGYSELGLYGNHADRNGATDDYEMRTVFGNFTAWECQREYARMKAQLNDQLVITADVFPGGPIFEDTSIFINGQQPEGAPFVKQGDLVEIYVDLNNNYATGAFTITTTLSGSTSVIQTDAVSYIYKVSFTVTQSGDAVPPSAGINCRISVNAPPVGYTDEEFYLDNTNPLPPTTFTAAQPSSSDASVQLDWAGATDNGREDLIDSYQIRRNGTIVKTLDYPANQWIDSSVSAGSIYEYDIRSFDKVGHTSAWFSPKRVVFVDLSFNPCSIATLPVAVNGPVTLSWSADPGDQPPITDYRVLWGRSIGSITNIASGGWLGGSTYSYIFNPATEDSPGHNGNYYFKIECDGGVSIYSAPASTLYDVEIPFPATIVGIPDQYHPTVAEIPVQWSGAFDAFSGLAYYELYRQDNGGGYVYINTFAIGNEIYYDTSITNGHTYNYYIRTYDAAGNYIDSAVETVTYYSDLVGATPNLKISTVSVNDAAEGRGASNPFDVTVTINNIGNLAGDVDTITLKFTHPSFGSVSHQYTVGSPSPGLSYTIGALSSQVFTFSGAYASPTADQGAITVDASMTGDTNDNAADSTDVIWIRDFAILDITDMYATPTMEIPSQNNIIRMNITNPMVTQVNLTSYSISISGWTLNNDYRIQGVNGPSAGTIMTGGQTESVIYFIEVLSGAGTGVHNVDFIANGVELVSGTSVTDTEASGASFSTGAMDSDPPIVSNVQVNPDPADPDAGDTVTITALISDASGIASATATIESPDESVITTITLYDDGAHGDGGNGDGTYGNTWDTSGQSEGTYYVDITAVDASPASNTYNGDNDDTFQLTDTTNPIISNVQVSSNPLERGSTQTITAQVNDASGLAWVRCYIESPDETPVTNFLLVDDGTNGDVTPGDNIFTGRWTSPTAALALHYIDITARDSSTAQNTGSLNNGATFWVEDTVGPSFSAADIIPNSGEIGTSFDIRITITDYSGVSSATAYIQSPDETNIDSVTLYDDGAHNDGAAGDNIWGGQWDSTGQSEGTYYVDVLGIDSSNNTNSAEAENIDANIVLGDSTPPTVININALPSTGDPEAGGMVVITCNVTDASGILSVTAYIEFPDETVQATLPMSPYGGTGYRATWDFTGEPVGTYYVDIRAIDNSAAQNQRNINNGDTFALVDNTIPTITNMQATPDPVEKGNNVNVSCQITDFSGISSATAFIQRPDGSTIYTLTLYDDGAHGDGGNGDGIFANQWSTSTAVLTTHYVDFRARDNSPALNERNVNNGDTFLVQDTTGPSLTNDAINPDSGEPGQIFTISIDATDLSGILSVTAYVQSPDESNIATLPMSNVGGNTYQTTWDSTGQSEGPYYVDVIAIDNSGSSNNNEAENIDANINIGDSTPPVVINVNAAPATGDPEVGGSVTITCDVSDASSGILDVYADIEMPDETNIETIQLYDDGLHSDGIADDGTYGNTWDFTGEAEGTYYVDIRARDDSTAQNQQNVNNGDTFSLVDNTLPTVSNVLASPDPVEKGNNVNISCQVTDLSGISSVTAYIQRPDGTNRATLTLYDDGAHGDGGNGDGLYAIQWSTTTAVLATHYVDIRAIDASSQNNERNINNGDTFVVQDTTGPSFSIANISPDSGELGTSFTISIDVTDVSGLSSVTAYVQSPDETNIATLPMTNVGGNTYQATWVSTGRPEGPYYVDVVAVDNSGISNSAEAENIDANIQLQDTTQPTIQNVLVNPVAGPINTLFTITADISDLSGILEAYATIENGTWLAAVEMYDDGTNGDAVADDGTYTGQWSSTGYTVGSYNVDVNATDNSIAQNDRIVDNAAVITLEAGDNTPPSITNVQATPDPASTGQIVTISATISDVSGIFTPNVTIVGIGTFDMTNTGGDNWQYQWNTAGVSDGMYDIHINATDMSINHNNNEFLNAEDVTVSNNPFITNIAITDDPLEKGATQTVTCNVYDFNGLSSVTAYIEFPDETVVATLPMSNIGGNTYQATWISSSASLGLYAVDFTAVDASGFSYTTNVNNGTEFTVQDTTGPSFSSENISPDSGELGTSFTISIDVTDLSGISSVIAYVQSPDETNIATLPMTNVGGNTYQATWVSTGRPEGTYYVDVVAVDNSGSSNSAEAENIDADIHLQDTTMPTVFSVSATPATGDPEVGTTITIEADVFDLSNISSCIAYIEFPDETVIATLTLYDDGTHGDGTANDGVWTNIWNSALKTAGIYNVDLRVRDGSSAQNERNVNNGDTFLLRDDTDPSVSNVLVSADPLELGNNLRITCTISDFSGISSATAYIQHSNGTYIATLTLFDDGTHGDGIASDGTYGTILWDSSGADETTYTIDVTAIDGSPQSNQQNVNDGDSFVLQDTTAPTVSNIQANPSSGDPEAGTIITISCTVTDESTLLAVTAYIESPDENVVDTLSMSHIGGGVYQATWNCGGEAEGNYFVDINATDSSNAENQRNINNGDTFTISDATAPVISNVAVSDDPLELGDSQIITCDVSDISGISSVTAYIESPDETVIATLPMSNVGGDTYSVSWDSSSATTGNYFVDIRAFDNSAALNQRDVDNGDTFILQDTVGPSFSNDQITDLNGGSPNVGDLFLIQIEINDLSGISSVTCYIQYPDETTNATLVMTDPDFDNIYNCTWDSAGKLEGRYYVDIVAVDNSGSANSAEAENIGSDIVLGDDIPPVVIYVDLVQPALGDPEAGGSIYITCNVSDPSGVLSVYADIESPDEIVIDTVQLYDDGLHGDGAALDGNYSNIWDFTGEAEGSYVVDIRARDNSLAQNQRNINNGDTFTLQDSTNPSVINVQVTPDPVELGNTITISCEVTDFSGITSVTAYIQNPDGTNRATRPMLHIGGNIYQATWSTTNYPIAGTYYVDINAVDASPNANANYTNNGDTFVVQDTTLPSISNIQAVSDVGGDTTAEVGVENFTITATVSDLSAITSVYARIYNGSGLQAYIQLNNLGGTSYGAEWNSTGLSIGIYSLEINATDSSSNTRTSVFTGTITLTNPVPEVTVQRISRSPDGYIGADNITFVLRIMTTRADIVILDVIIINLESHISFTKEQLNITLPYTLTVATGWLYIELNYSINSGATPQKGIDPGRAQVSWENVPGDISDIDISGGYNTVNIYTIPVIASTLIDIRDVSGNVTSIPNTVEIIVEATQNAAEDYEVWIDLTAWGIPNYGINKTTWNNLRARYILELTDVPSGIYLGADITAIVNLSITAGYREDTSAIPNGFQIDSIDPVIDGDYFKITSDAAGLSEITQIDPSKLTQFYIWIKVNDSEAADTGVLSVNVDLADKLFSFVDQGSDMWRATISLASIDDSFLMVQKEKLEFKNLIAVDRAGNSDSYDASSKSLGLIDTTAPEIDFGGFTLGGMDIDDLDKPIEIPAGEYISIEIKVNDDKFGLGVMYVRVYYKIEGGGDIEPSADDDWKYIDLAKMEDKYFGVLSAPNSVGFKSSMTVELYFEIADFEENIYNTKDDKIELVFTEEVAVYSYIFLGFASVAFLGAVLYRLVFYRKKVKIIDLDLMKPKKAK